MRKHILVAMIAILILALATAAMAADDPFVGTWKLNLEKSKLLRNRQGAPIQSRTTRIETVDNGLRIFDDTVRDGKTTHNEDSYKLDGKDYPMTNGSSVRSCTRIDANSFVCVQKDGGKETGRMYFAVSKDGKMGFISGVTKDAQGKDGFGIMVTEKQ